MAQKSEFRMGLSSSSNELHVSAGHLFSSHKGTKINDISAENDAKSYLYPPFDCKVVELANNSGNSVVFQSLGLVDIPGHSEPVNVCFRCTHINQLSIDNSPIELNKIYYKDLFVPCYQEGTAGVATGNHIHIEFALGTYIRTETVMGVNRMVTTWLGDNRLFLTEACYIRNGSTIRRNDAKPGFYCDEYPATLSNGVKGRLSYFATKGTSTSVQNDPYLGEVKMTLFGSAAYLRRDVMGEKIILVPQNCELTVVGLYSWNASDGYKWGYAKYGENLEEEGYFQFDPKVMSLVGKPTDGRYKMRLHGSGANLRVKPVNGSASVTVPNGSDIEITEFLPTVESDSYFWFKGKWGTREGYFQYDPKVMFPTND
ncbi:MAG: hypothetical protein RR945_05210 [Erysipelotrichaceae bacterium]|uniref:hypothetical protein n=1 Tax=Anaerorhabdus sp. TaxID=1872524 RepID=UPI002FC76082